ncbi:MAG: CADD family putative folate metabolism protein [Parachlamydia sp.]|jgi:pyrroloquinoline-quinone synthase|nr:CADD family putative folate metabolism protein [Parachlamydia sp.]
MMISNKLIDDLDKIIQKKHMLFNPFYQAWSNGELTSKQLQFYAKEYYSHVNAFPTYLSALHSRCTDKGIRKELLQNLIDEEAGEPNHPDLWESFALAVRVSHEELLAPPANEETGHLIEFFQESCRSLPLSFGITSLYCYESQIPTICPTKIEGLKKWYGIQQAEDYHYFTVHQAADVEHSRAERKMIEQLVTPQEEEKILKHADQTMDQLNSFLSSFL